MQLGDCHIYEQHYAKTQNSTGWSAVESYLMEVDRRAKSYEAEPHYVHNASKGKDFLQFEPKDLLITKYKQGPKLDLELYS